MTAEARRWVLERVADLERLGVTDIPGQLHQDEREIQRDFALAGEAPRWPNEVRDAVREWTAEHPSN